jgi:hypothetical protein
MELREMEEKPVPEFTHTRGVKLRTEKQTDFHKKIKTITQKTTAFTMREAFAHVNMFSCFG